MKFSTGVAMLAATQSVAAIPLDIANTDSIKSAASIVATKMMSLYTGNKPGGIPGLIGEPYYWWEAGAMFGALIDYWYYTGDDQFNDDVIEGMLFQTGDKNNFMPENQTRSLGNDDQGFWGLAAMSAAEAKFPNPPANRPQYLALAQAVFNSQANRWDTSACNGGLRWQIFAFNNGYTYRNTISNGCFFNLAARLGAYTGNQTYNEWAERTWDWSKRIGLIGEQYQMFDGSDDKINCTEMNHIQWSYNAGVYMYGAAIMYNQTGSDVWKDRVQKIWDASSIFFRGAEEGSQGQIMYEVACEPYGTCNNDQVSFKAYLARWMAASLKVAPFLRDQMMPFLQASAAAAAQACVGMEDGVTCGTVWYSGGFNISGAQADLPGSRGWGPGQQMSALENIQSLLIDQAPGPLTMATGGISEGDAAAGSEPDIDPDAPVTPITTGDRAGAGILTALLLVGLLGGAWWMIA